MTNLNANELTILKACFDNAQDAAGGDFGFSDEIWKYVATEFDKKQVAGYLSQLQDKGLIWLDHCKTDTFDGNQITFPRFAFYVGIKAGILTEEEADHFEQFNDYYDMNGNPDDYEVPEFEAQQERMKDLTAEIGLDEPEAAPETMTYGQVADAALDAKELEAHAATCLDLAKASAGSELFGSRTEQYREAAQNAIVARLAWLEIRNDFESGK